MLDGAPRAVFVLLDLAGLDEVAQDPLCVEAVVQLLLAPLDLGLVMLELIELMLHGSVFALRLLALGFDFDGRSASLGADFEHIHADSILD